MRIVVVGSGGREHALAHRLGNEGHEVVAAPGNPGISARFRTLAVDPVDVARAAPLIAGLAPDLVVIGPEAPLAAGLADALRGLGVATFGPSAAAARLESSKAFAKQVMHDAKIPTARHVLTTDVSSLDRAVAEMNGRVAVKADGLAAGKGVVVCASIEEAREAGRKLLALGPVVVEERLEGPEVSVIALTDGTGVVLLPTARDHKRLQDGDDGPNTGGMGAICPVPFDARGLIGTVFKPALERMAELGTPFSGALYAGLMLTADGPKVLEFNARFGDPETQAIVESLGDEFSLARLLSKAATGGLVDAIVHAARTAVCVVVASEGYPDAPVKGDVIEGLEAASASGARVFHAGTSMKEGRLVTSGGRVLGIVGAGPDARTARELANRAASEIRIRGAQRRTDIGVSVA